MAKYTKMVSGGARVYYFDVYTDKRGKDYLTITEFNKRTNVRSCIFIHPENVEKIKQALVDAFAIVSKR